MTRLLLTFFLISFFPALAQSALDPELRAALVKLNAGGKGNKGTVLVVLPSADAIVLRNGKKQPTGYFLRELTDPLQEILLSGYDIEFATLEGHPPVVDRSSLKRAWYAYPDPTDASRRQREAVEIRALVDQLNGSSLPLNFDNALKKVNEYVGLLVPGGHAAMVDLLPNSALGKILNHFHAYQKPMALLSHGPVALLSAAGPEGWPFSGYRISVASTADEKVLESRALAPLIGSSSGPLQDYPDQLLMKAGAVLSISPSAGTPNLTRDREVITAQNPASAAPAGKLLIKAIEERFSNRPKDEYVDGITEKITIADLSRMSRQQLEELFHRGAADAIPLGEATGLGLVFPGHPTLNFLSQYIWQGKIFEASSDGVVLVNKVFGRTRTFGRTLDARVSQAPSAFDDKPSIRLDYSGCESILTRHLIDEIRKIGPDLYLGRGIYRGSEIGFFALYFNG